MLRRTFAVGMALVTVVLAACAQPQQPQQDPELLRRTDWSLTQYFAGGRTVDEITPGADGVPWIRFSAAQATGNGGVNSFGGPYTADKSGSLSLGPLTSTQMAGPPPLMDQESAYFSALQQAKSYRVSQRSLELLDGKGRSVARFEPREAVSLEGTDWLCTGYNNGEEAFVSIVVDTRVTARFEGGALAGSSGVNDYTGSYTVNGTALTIGSAAATTQLSGTADAMDQESAYLSVLPQVARYRIEGSELTLLDSEGLRLATYRTLR